MSKKRDTIVAEVETLPQDDVVDLYQKLADSYTQKKTENEEFKQQIYQISQQSKILASSQIDLQQELESINSVHKEELDEIMRRNVLIVEGLREKNSELLSDKIHLETKVDQLTTNLTDLQKELEDVKQTLLNQTPQTRVSDGFERNLLNENEELKEMLKEMELKWNESKAQSVEQSLYIEEMKERLLCLEDNLETKKTELEEKDDAIEELQEKNQELIVELAILKTSPEDGNRKGNSLFAEVDDQRQKMKCILQGERAHYLDMKKSFNAKEMEIRRLKRENMNIKKEIQTCSNLLARGEQVSLQAMSARVNHLQAENKKLKSALLSSEKKLISLAEQKNLGWIESLLSTANTETREMKDKLFILMIEKTSLADNFNKTQRELAKSRLDCVKLKLLLTRIVEAHNIVINEEDYFDIGLDSEVLENLKVEQFECLDDENPSAFSGEELNESTIALLGGREGLLPFVPYQNKKEEPENQNKKEELEDKENRNSYEKLTKTSSVPKIAEISKTEKESERKPLEIPAAKPLEVIKVSEAVKQQEVSKSPLKHRNNHQLSQAQNAPSPKTVTFSAVTSSRVIDNTPEEFEASQKARKRPGVVVKRITIPSKGSAKSTQ